MRIRELSIHPLTLPLKESYEVAYQRFDTAQLIFVRLPIHGGLAGLGSASPEEAVTGESPDACLAFLHRSQPVLAGADPFRRASILKRLKDMGGRRHPAAMAALDMALWDIAAKAMGQPLWKLLGGYRDRMRTSVTIGIMDLDRTLEQAGELASQGFTCFKIKGGHDPEEDARRAVAVRKLLGPGAELRFDANQGYTVQEAFAFLRAARPARLSILEQPTAKEDDQALGTVTGKSQIPIMADESLTGVREAFRLARNGLVDMVNIKLMKVGGISDALVVGGVARAAGWDVMVGCMDESALAIAAGLAFALSTPTVRYADLDGHLDLVDDPAGQAVRMSRGMLFPSSAPGLGVSDLDF